MVVAVVVELYTVHSGSAMLEKSPPLSEIQMVNLEPWADASDGTWTPICCHVSIRHGADVYVELPALDESKRVRR